MSDTAIQWIIICALFIPLPISYLQVTKTGKVQLAIKIGSYLGALVIGMLIALVFVAAQIIGPGPIFILIVSLPVFAHYCILKKFSTQK